MNRLDVYSAVHKMQRARLCKLIVHAGVTDPDDHMARQQLASAVDVLIAELRVHADHEDSFIHPLLRTYAPDIAERLDAEHEALDARLADLAVIASRYAGTTTPAEPSELYRALAAFGAAYFAHIAIEEAEALPALWECCTDEELTGILDSFRDSRSATENLTSLLAELATLNPPEIALMVTAGLGEVDLSELREALSTLLSPAQLGALFRSLDSGTLVT